MACCHNTCKHMREQRLSPHIRLMQFGCFSTDGRSSKPLSNIDRQVAQEFKHMGLGVNQAAFHRLMRIILALRYLIQPALVDDATKLTTRAGAADWDYGC